MALFCFTFLEKVGMAIEKMARGKNGMGVVGSSRSNAEAVVGGKDGEGRVR